MLSKSLWRKRMFIFDIIYVVIGMYFAYVLYDVAVGITNDYSKC